MLRAGIAAILALVLSVAAAVPAGAVPPPPPNPSDQQIQDGQAAADTAAADVGRLSGVVSKTQDQIQQLRDAMELKAELVMKASADLELAQQDAAAASADAIKAQQAADNSGQQITTATSDAAAFAAASFRQGSVLGSMSALLDSSSLTDLLQREQMLDQVSSTQLGVIANLQAARNNKANLDSAARAALDKATAAKEKAIAAKQAADDAKAAADKAFADGQQQLAQLSQQLATQQAQYQAALDGVAGLQGQRAQYDKWLADKQAEDLRLQQEAEARAQVMAAAQQSADEEAQVQAHLDSLKKQQVAAEQTKQAAILAEQIRQEQIRLQAIKEEQQRKAAAEQAARDDAARKAQAQAQAQSQAQAQAQPAPKPSSGSSGSSAPAASFVSAGSGSSRGQQVVNAALQWLGTPYAWGGGTSSGPSQGIRDYGTADSYGDYRKVGFDCSGLALYAWAQVGVYLPHYSGYQYFSGKHVAAGDLQPGDLLFYAYNTSDPGTIHHVAIYMGGGKMIQSPQSGSYVMISPMRWSGYIGATRPGT